MTTTTKTAKTKEVKAEKKIAVTLLTDVAEITSGIASIKNRAKGLNNLVHQVAVSTLNHADVHGDVTLANTLIAELPGSFRKNALIAWYENFGKFRYNTTAKELVYIADKVTNLQEAIQLPFWKYKTEAAYQPFNITYVLNKMLNKATKGKELGDPIPDEFLDDVASMIAKYSTTADDVLAA